MGQFLVRTVFNNFSHECSKKVQNVKNVPITTTHARARAHTHTRACAHTQQYHTCIRILVHAPHLPLLLPLSLPLSLSRSLALPPCLVRSSLGRRRMADNCLSAVFVYGRCVCFIVGLLCFVAGFVSADFVMLLFLLLLLLLCRRRAVALRR